MVRLRLGRLSLAEVTGAVLCGRVGALLEPLDLHPFEVGVISASLRRHLLARTTEASESLLPGNVFARF